MKWTSFFLYLISISIYAQDSIQTIRLETIPLKLQTLVGIDNFDTKYYIENQSIFNKKEDSKTTNYSNVQLGEITTADIYNPLKMVLFYQNFNTAIILDNRLAEIFKIDFNARQPYRNVSHVSIGNDNTIWIFNQDLQQLQLYDYKSNQIRVSALPIASPVLDLTSNYNYAWLLTEKYIYKYSYFGSLLYKIKNNGFTALTEKNDNVYLQKENTLFFLNDKTETITALALPELLIKQFFVTGETLYIYDSENLHKFQLKN